MVDAKSIKDKVSNKINNARSKIGTKLPAHKHCRICGIDIKVTSEDRICKSAECSTAFEKRGRNDRVKAGSARAASKSTAMRHRLSARLAGGLMAEALQMRRQIAIAPQSRIALSSSPSFFSSSFSFSSSFCAFSA